MKFRILRALLYKELQQMRRTRFIPMIILMMPVMVMLIIPLVANLDVRNVGVAVVDHDNTQLSRRIVADMGASERMTVVEVCPTFDEAMKMVEHDRADVVLTIPADFSKGGVPVDISANGVNATKGMLGAQYVSQSVILTLQRQEREVSDAVSVINRFNTVLDFRHYMIPALMVVLIIIICGFLPALNIVGEKESGTIEAMNVTPVGRFTFVLSKLIPYWVAGLLVVTVGMIVARLVYGLAPTGSVGLIYLAAILFTLVMSGLGVIIANKSDTLLQSIFVMFAIIVIFQLMGGLFTPVSSMPEWAQYFTLAVPPRYFNEIMRAVYLKGSGLADLWVQYLCLAGYAAGLCVIAAVTYRKRS